ncbi:MAG: ribosome small subunit-dependent GTPase A [Phycisphaerales bacterium]|nr:ribosome small subunit-dependent GTPase A [Phycisphaerales bacterium]
MAKDRSKGPKKQGRKVRVDFRKNREKTARDKAQWTRHYREDSIQHEDTAKEQSVRAKGELSRKRTVIIHDESTGEKTWQNGLVVRMRGLIAEVDDGHEIWACTVRRLLRTRLIKERHPITVGDRVRFVSIDVAGEQSQQVSDDRELPEGVIQDVEERTTTLVRHYDRRLQVVAANVDLALIVAAADQPTLRPHLIDRYLVAVHCGDMRPVVCINKTDLDCDGFAEDVAERYRSIGYSALLASVVDHRGIDELRETLRDQTSVLVGPSGVGKSSLLNTLDPNLSLRVGSLTDLQRGRHTTTTANLLKWAFGGYVVDTPGMRQFDIADVEATELEAYFLEFVDLISKCRFPDCSHTHEEDCAVKAALEEGAVFQERYDSYCKMYEECRAKEKDKH